MFIESIIYFLSASLLSTTYYCGRSMARRAGTPFYVGPSLPMIAVWAAPILAIALFIAGFWLVPWYVVLIASFAATLAGSIAGTLIGLSRAGPYFPLIAIASAAGFFVRLLRTVSA